MQSTLTHQKMMPMMKKNDFSSTRISNVSQNILISVILSSLEPKAHACIKELYDKNPSILVLEFKETWKILFKNLHSYHDHQ